MIDWPSSRRRLYLTSVALLAAGLLLRTQVSSALVTRGDDLNYRGELLRARMMYGRALALDPDNAEAADRFVFASLLSHERTLVKDAVRVAGEFMARHPAVTALEEDRALCYQALRDWASAEQAFARVGVATGDARALTFAGFDALRVDRRGAARALFAKALALDPAYLPARRAFERGRPWEK